METVSSYLKAVTGARTVRAAAAVLCARLGVSMKAVEMAAHRKHIPARWYPVLLDMAEARGMGRPPAHLFVPEACREAGEAA